MPRLAEIQFANVVGFEAQKRDMYPAYQQTILLWETGMRAYQEFHAIEQPACEHDRLLTDDCDGCERY